MPLMRFAKFFAHIFLGKEGVSGRIICMEKVRLSVKHSANGTQTSMCILTRNPMKNSAVSGPNRARFSKDLTEIRGILRLTLHFAMRPFLKIQLYRHLALCSELAKSSDS